MEMVSFHSLSSNDGMQLLEEKLTDKEWDEMIKELDQDGDGKVTLKVNISSKR